MLAASALQNREKNWLVFVPSRIPQFFCILIMERYMRTHNPTNSGQI